MQTIALQTPKQYRDPKHMQATAVSTHGEATVVKMGGRRQQSSHAKHEAGFRRIQIDPTVGGK
jgi:hypothetical protein